MSDVAHLGHEFELYWETVKYKAPEADKPALKNVAQRFHTHGTPPVQNQE